MNQLVIFLITLFLCHRSRCQSSLYSQFNGHIIHYNDVEENNEMYEIFMDRLGSKPLYIMDFPDDETNPLDQPVILLWDYPFPSSQIYRGVDITIRMVANTKKYPGSNIKGSVISKFNTSMDQHEISYSIRYKNKSDEIFHRTLYTLYQNLRPVEIPVKMPAKLAVKKGDDLELFCGCVGSLDLYLAWKTPNRNNTENRYFFNERNLTIKNITFEDQGKYRCVCTNFMQKAENYIAIKVFELRYIGNETRNGDDDTTNHVSYQRTDDENGEEGEETFQVRIEEWINENGGYLSIVIFFTTIIVLVTLCICVCVLCCRLKRRRIRTEYLMSQLEKLNTSLKSGSDGEDTPLADNYLSDILNSKYNTKWEIKRDDIKIGCKIGEGFYGKIMKGSYKNQDVAIKTLKDTLNTEHVRSLIIELKILSHLESHKNIVSLIGACTSRLTMGELYIVVELCDIGNLKNFLIKCRPTFRDQKRMSGISPQSNDTDKIYAIDMNDLLKFCYQISCGMNYLLYKNVLHRDLAARNILVTSNKTIKLCDFGLSRNLYEESRYDISSHIKLPIKWMAIESFSSNTYTTKSDVWSFGVTCWEIFTLGMDPYLGVEYSDLKNMIKKGYRLDQPRYCPEDIFLIMKRCWEEDPNERPSFPLLVEIFDQFVNQPKVETNREQTNVPGYVTVMRATSY